MEVPESVTDINVLTTAAGVLGHGWSKAQCGVNNGISDVRVLHSVQ
jgi:hypothetical protein